MVSSNEAGFNPRESEPLPRNTLHGLELCPESTGQQTNPAVLGYPKGYRSRSLTDAGSKVESDHLSYSDSVWDTAERGMGCGDNCHLSCLAKFIIVNVGGLSRNAKLSSPTMSAISVGAAIVV